MLLASKERRRTPERRSPSTRSVSGSPCWLDQVPANSSTAPSGPSRRTVSVGSSRVDDVTTRAREQIESRPCGGDRSFAAHRARTTHSEHNVLLRPPASARRWGGTAFSTYSADTRGCQGDFVSSVRAWLGKHHAASGLPPGGHDAADPFSVLHVTATWCGS